ncbi:tagaturonate reductase [Melghirimyces profundicolus]|uniref:Tagaturonate reductase n=1 Tax=Melghirimyces profundicolus TaxID=1242148 RepID=A0A2T6BD74_9BACL|nr:tagaturonate reductase [Melghirimyces profundicolus]PTX53979.1 tagaturonate reductase [Melghirimyces profundicolus]
MKHKTARGLDPLNKGWLRDHRPDESGIEQVPERIVQFGEGRFLRGFFDWMIHRLNRSGHWCGRIVAVQPTPRGKVVPVLNAQDGLYTVVLEGLQNGKPLREVELVTSISRGINPYEEWEEVLKLAERREIEWVVSNTTEAGLTYQTEAYSPGTAPLSFPGKLTAFLHRRYEFFSGAPEAGMWILPCELVEDNGDVLRDLVLKVAGDWELPGSFKRWVENSNVFCNTLVDRIVTGDAGERADELFEELGYEDRLLTVAERYHLFAVEGDPELKEHLPLHKAGLHVHWDSVAHYRELKLRILNGTHTLLFAPALLGGCETVSEAMKTKWLHRLATQALDSDILPVLEGRRSEKKRFAEDVLERFANPRIHHRWVDIGQNGVTKYHSRLLELLKRWKERNNRIPDTLAFSLAALIRFYQGEVVDEGVIRIFLNGSEDLMREKPKTVSFFADVWAKWDGTPGGLEQLAAETLKNTEIWGEDLCSSIPWLHERVSVHLQRIVEQGIQQASSQLEI